MLDQSDSMPENQKCQTLPPWLWVWFAYYIYKFPALIELLKEDLGSFLFSTDPTFASMTLFNRFKLLNIPLWIPSIFLFLGVLSVFFPHVRTYYVEKKFKLTDNYTKVPSIIEIEDFLKLHAPNLKIKTNLLSQSEIVFIYPIGYRKTCIAIFGRLVKSWRSDREATQAILLHEIGHYRNGDALILGTGSLFQVSVYYIILYMPILILLSLKSSPNVVIFATMPADNIAVLFLAIASYTLPLVGIWCAELNADRFMVKSKINTIDNSLKVIDNLKKNKFFKQRLFYHITHPPNSLRRWMAVHSNEEKSVLLFILFYPLAKFSELLMLIMYALSLFLTLFILRAKNIQEFSNYLKPIIMDYIHEGSYRWLLFSIGIILWPILAVYWVRFFSGMYEKYNLASYKSYFLSALVLLCLFVFSNSVI